jgi:hypothetical protein
MSALTALLVAMLGTVDDWQGVPFRQPQFNQVREYVAQYYHAPADPPHAWALAANGALVVLTPTGELLPKSFYETRKSLPGEQVRLGGKVVPVPCGGQTVPGVVIHRVPPDAERPQPPPSTDQERQDRRVWLRARRDQYLQAWQGVAFGSKEFACMMAFVEAELARTGAGAPRPPAWDEGVSERPRSTGSDFAWLNAASAWLRALDPHSDLVAKAFWDRATRPATKTTKQCKVVLLDVTGERLAGGFGVVRVADFVAGTAKRFRNELNRLHAKKGLHGLIVDLRGNGGGVLDEAVGVADQFLGAVPIVRVVKRAGEEEIVQGKADPSDSALPLVVLVDGSCASACEVLALTLRDHARAAILGARSYGKASVQQLFRPFSAGYFVKLTIAQYQAPSGRSVQVVGLEPDVEVPAEPGKPLPMGPREGDLQGHLASAAPAEPTPNPLLTDAVRLCAEATPSAADTVDLAPKIAGDYRISVALRWLRCLTNGK